MIQKASDSHAACYFADHQKEFDQNAFSQMCTYKSQLQIFSNSRLFDLMLHERILKHAMKDTVYIGVIPSAVEQRVELLATLVHFTNAACALSRHTAE